MKKIIPILFLICLTQYSIGQVIPQRITVLNSAGGSGTNKVDSATTSNDSLYYWINGSKRFGGLVGSGGSVTISPGTGVTITGTGTSIDPYVINATGGSGGNGGRYVIPDYGIIVDSSVANQYKIGVDSLKLKDTSYVKKGIKNDTLAHPGYATLVLDSPYVRDTLLNLAGGTTGQALIKISSTNGDWSWAAVGGSSPIDTTNKWVNNVVQQDDSTINVFKGGTVTALHIHGGGGSINDSLYVNADTTADGRYWTLRRLNGQVDTLGMRGTDTSHLRADINANTVSLTNKANNSNTVTINGSSQTLGSNPNFTVSSGSGLPAQSIVNSYLKSNGTSASWSRLKFNNPPTWIAVGDSYMYGNGASVSTNDFLWLLAGLYGKNNAGTSPLNAPLINNLSLGGTGVWYSTKQLLANVNATNQISPVNTALSLVEAGVNNLNASGYNPKTTAKILNAYNAIITNSFINTMAGAGAGTGVTRTGTWGTYNAVPFGGKFTTAASSATNGSYIEYSFLGDNISVGLQAGDSIIARRATFSVSIDGVTQAGTYTEQSQTDGITLAAESYNNARTQMAINFFGLTDSSHVIRLTNTSADSLVVDYFAVLNKPAFTSPILFFEIPYFKNYSLSGSNALTLQTNNSIDSLIATWGNYPIVVAKTNKYYNSYYTDNIHPSDIGHRQIYHAAYDALDSLINVNPSPQVYGAQGNNRIFGGLQVQGAQSGAGPLPVAGAGLELYYNGTGGVVSAYNRSASYIPLGFIGSNITLTPASGSNGTVYLSPNNNLTVGDGIEVPSSAFTVSNPVSVFQKASIPFPRMSTGKRDTLTSSIATTTRVSAGSGYTPGTYTNVPLICVSCANPLSSGVTIPTIIVPAGGTMPFLSAIPMGTYYTVGDVLEVNNSSVGGTGSGASYTVATLKTGTKGEGIMDTAQNNLSVYNGQNWSGLITTSLSAINATFGTDYVFTGSTSTFTLPAISTSIVGRQNAILITNLGTGTITVNTASGSTLIPQSSTTAGSTINVVSGASAMILPTGTSFKVLYNN